MEGNATDNIVRIELLRLNHGMSKLCKCYEPVYEVDTVNRLVYCKCGAIVDPFDALKYLARHWERADRELKWARDEVNHLNEYKPWLRAIKELENQYRSKMIPFCPECKTPVDIVKLAHSGTCSRSYAEKMEVSRGQRKEPDHGSK